MQVLKFGGSSVASSEAMLRVIEIVRKALEEDRTIVVSSAVSGCTDALIQTGHKAAARDESYKDLIADLRKRHYKIIGELLPEGYRERTAASVDKLFESLEGITYGVYLLGELSQASLEAIEGFGELFSTAILTDKFLSLGITCQWLDAREFVQVRDGEVDEPETYARVAKTINSNPHVELFVVPGFIATDGNGRVTTLGRGGSHGRERPRDDARPRRLRLHGLARGRGHPRPPRGDMDRCPGYHDGQSEDCPDGPSHPEHLLSGGAGTVPFRGQGHLPADHPTRC